MTDQLEISASPDVTEPPLEQPAELVAFADCELIVINSAMTMVINRNNGNQQIIAPQVVEALKTCTTFRTIADHAAHLANTRPELNGNQEMAATVLSNLNNAGILLRAKDICARWAQPAPARLAPTRAFIITCDRPAAVQRLLDSMLRTGKLSQHDALFLIDDSREQPNREANREAVAKFNLRSAKAMFYVGLEAQNELLSGLIQQLPAHERGMRFLLDPQVWREKKTYGRSRTLCLLLSVGYRALMMDDDILCQAIRPPFTEPGIGIDSGGIRKAAFFADEEKLLSSAVPEDFDPLSGHASLLGSTLGTALRTLNKEPLAELDLQRTNAALANVLQADSPVLVTQCGSWGDPGIGGAHWTLFLGEDSIERLISAPHGISAAIENRFSWLGSTRTNIFKMPFMSQLTGLDNSHILPPYFPAFRGEDALFGAMLVAIQRNGVALEYPWSVPHLPIEARAYSLKEPIAGSGGIQLLARYLTTNIDYKDSTDPEHNLRYLAQDARRLAARSDADLLLDYRSGLAKGQADQLYLLQNQFSRAEKLQSSGWQEYLKRGIEEVQQAIAVKQSPTAIRGVPQNTTEQELMSQFREMATGFAAALEAWSEMRSIASVLTGELISSNKILPH